MCATPPCAQEATTERTRRAGAGARKGDAVEDGGTELEKLEGKMELEETERRLTPWQDGCGSGAAAAEGGGRGVLRSRGRGERLLALEGMVWSRGRLLSNVDDPVCVTGARPATSPSLLGRKPQTSWTWTWSRNGKTGPQLRF